MERRTMILALTLGLVVVAGLPAASRMSSTAQEPERPSARVALRQRIADLRGDVALREVELEAKREVLKQKLMRVPVVNQQIADFRSEIRTTSAPDKPFERFDTSTRDALIEMASAAGSSKVETDMWVKAFDDAVKSKDFESFRKATLEWLSNGESWAKVAIDNELAPLKKDFTRHTSELAFKRLELEDLEKQYRESR